MAYNSQDRAAAYRARAEELRILAAYLKHQETRTALIGLADGYDRMADGAKQLDRLEIPNRDH